MEDLDSVARDVIAECDEDYVGLWSVIRGVRNAGVTDYPQLRTTTLSLLKELMRHHRIAAGQFKNNIFERWHGSDQEISERIEQEWIHLKREPTMGDIVWFVASTLRKD